MCRSRLYLRQNKLSAHFSDSAIEDIADALGVYGNWKQVRVVGQNK